MRKLTNSSLQESKVKSSKQKDYNPKYKFKIRVKTMQVLDHSSIPDLLRTTKEWDELKLSEVPNKHADTYPIKGVI